MNIHISSNFNTSTHLGALLFVALLSSGLGSCYCWPADAKAATAATVTATAAATAATTWQHQILRGGSSSTQVLDEAAAAAQQRNQVPPAQTQTSKYYMDQQLLLQLRATILTELLARRGLPLVTMEAVATPEGAQKPQVVDWDCAMSTREEPKTCLYSFDAEPLTKVVAPLGTTQWISLSALNRLRRTDPTKVEPMWHSQYTILQGWFGPASEYSLLKEVGLAGLVLSVLLDRPGVLRSIMGLTMLTMVVVFLPLLEFLLHKFLISTVFWNQWPTWGRIAHAALPLKLLLAQMAYKSVLRVFSSLELKVRDALVDMESTLLEVALPLTVGPGSETVQVEGFERELVEEEDELDQMDDDEDEDASWDDHEEEDDEIDDSDAAY